MPEVDMELTIAAPIEKIWATILAVEVYPTFMEDVLETRVTRPLQGGRRASFWSVRLKGSILEWEEEEEVDDVAHRLTFSQVEGDMERIDGVWSLVDREDGTVTAHLLVDFEVGIPLLADMLNPLAARAIFDNSQRMLLDVEDRVTR